MEVKRFTELFLMLLIVFASCETVMPTEIRECESLSHKFRGLCMSDTNCHNVCLTEGFTGGHCKGMRRRCFCTKNCEPGSSPPPPEAPEPPEPPSGGPEPPLAI